MIDYVTPLLLTLCGTGFAAIGAFFYKIGRSDERDHAKQKYKAENIKLRKLCHDLRKEYTYLRARPHSFYTQHKTNMNTAINDRMADIDDRMRELEIEVE